MPAGSAWSASASAAPSPCPWWCLAGRAGRHGATASRAQGVAAGRRTTPGRVGVDAMLDWTVVVPAFLAAAVEWVEAFTIVLAVSLSIGWRAASGAALAALAAL